MIQQRLYANFWKMSKRNTWRRSGIVALNLVIVMLLATVHAQDAIEISTVSTMSHLVSGGDVLVRVDIPQEVQPEQVTIELNGQDVSSAFRVPDGESYLLGLVQGLNDGDNTLTAEVEGQEPTQLTVTNYPITGPIVSGPQIQPFICQTEAFQLPDGSTLGPPLDDECSAPTNVQYVYMPSTWDGFQPLPDTTSLPEDVAVTTTLEGVSVPFVVRVETGTMNRGIYQNVVLHDPTSESEPSPISPPEGWNDRLIAYHGSGCTGGWYIQGAALGADLLGGTNIARLSEGYALFTNTLNHPTNSCNAFLAGETTMMGKEHFIETFGVPFLTVSTGGSGGAYTSLQVADAFPGLFDGVLISSTFPDALSIALAGLDAHLLRQYFVATNPTDFTEEQQVAVTGYKHLPAFVDAANQMGRTDPVPGRNIADYSSLTWNDTLPPEAHSYNSAVWRDVVPEELRYDPATNATGARPTIFDLARNIYGTDPSTGAALRPFDNVGVQYGLEALNAGAITTAQFLDLNENIGGYDQDANFVSSRSVGDVRAIERTYQSGLSLGGGGGLTSIPVFDVSGLYDEDTLYHYQWFHFAVRERMKNENGNADNHVMWRGGLGINELLGERTPAGAALSSVVNHESWDAFMEWVTAVQSDSSDASQREKVIQNKPTYLVDGCWTKEVDPLFIPEPQTWSSEPDTACNALWPSFSFARKVAGGPLDANILKCQLKLIDPNDYNVTFTEAEMERFNSIFPDGVCDWSEPGAGQTDVVPWGSFGPSPVNQVFDVTKE